MATRHGAYALGMQETRGRLEPGLRADLMAVDTRSLRMRPLVHNGMLSNVIANLVYCASAADVSDVFVAGEPLVRNGRHVRLDAERVASELQDVWSRLERHLGS